MLDNTTLTTPRTTEPICPPWCAGHDGQGHQDWELANGRTWERSHAEAEGVTVGPVRVTLDQIQHPDGMSAPVVVVYADDLQSSPDLTPTQVRELTRVLAEAAERAEAVR